MHPAFVDESQPGGTGSGAPYIVTASIPFAPEAMDLDRGELRALLPRGQKKIHWSQSVPAFREQIVQTIAGYRMMHWGVIGESVVGEHPERARGLALEMLFRELAALEMVEDVWLESRGTAADKRDREVLDMLRRKREPIGGLRINHLPGPAEPLLWIPDAVCGVIGCLLAGERAFADALRHQLHLVPTNAGYGHRR